MYKPERRQRLDEAIDRLAMVDTSEELVETLRSCGRRVSGAHGVTVVRR